MHMSFVSLYVLASLVWSSTCQSSLLDNQSSQFDPTYVDSSVQSSVKPSVGPNESLLKVEEQVSLIYRNQNDELESVRSKTSTTRFQSRLTSELARLQRRDSNYSNGPSKQEYMEFAESNPIKSKLALTTDAPPSNENNKKTNLSSTRSASEVDTGFEFESSDVGKAREQTNSSANTDEQSPLQARSTWIRRRPQPSKSTKPTTTAVPVSVRSSLSGKPSFDLVHSINSFAFKLFNHLQQKPDSKNVLISPFNLFGTLIVLRSATAGQTMEELSTLLELEQVPDDLLQVAFKSLKNTLKVDVGVENQLDMMNAMLVDERVNVSNDFVTTMQNYYDLYFKKVGFEKEPLEVFRWSNKLVSWFTKGQIPQLLSNPPQPLTKILFLNAVYFKGKWKQPFNAKYTTPMPFHNADGSDSQVPTMRLTSEFESYCEDPNGANDNQPICAIVLPYAGNNLEMILLVGAQPGGQNSQATLQSRLNLTVYEKLLSNIQERPVQLNVPRFEFEDVNELKEPMKLIGAKSSFSDEPINFSRFLALGRSSAALLQPISKLNGNYSELGLPSSSSSPTTVKPNTNSSNNDLDIRSVTTTTESSADQDTVSKTTMDLFVNQFRHKCALRVDEKGSVASGATVVQIGNRSGGGRLAFDRPFVTIIRDKVTGVILFVGRVSRL